MKVVLPTESDVMASLRCLLVVISGIIKLCYADMLRVMTGTLMGRDITMATVWLPGFAEVPTQTLRLCLGQLAKEHYEFRISPAILKMTGFPATRSTGRLAHVLLLQLPLYTRMVSAMADTGGI